MLTDAEKLKDGTGKYRLVGIVSHMGANTACGHYVCHLFKDGRWVIYNDEKVAVSENPPIELAYIYMFRRIDASIETRLALLREKLLAASAAEAP